MEHDIAIELGTRRIGSISIVKSPQRLHGVRVASGFEIQVPIELTFRIRPKHEPMLMISDLRGKVLIKTADGSLITVGRLTGNSYQTAGVSGREAYDHSTTTYLEWSGTFADLAHIEKIRNGQSPKLQMDLEGEWCLLLPNIEKRNEERWNELSDHERERFQEYASFRLRTEPQRVHGTHGFIEVPYPRDIWIQLLRTLGIAENVLIEIPLPTTPPDPWTGVWNALVDARNAFDQGGTSGWQGSVTSVRLALERWRDIEPEDQGPGWTAPTRSDRESRTKKQRLNGLRWHLMQAAHLGPHTGAEEWSRDDAVLMLSVLSALLAERKPLKEAVL